MCVFNMQALTHVPVIKPAQRHKTQQQYEYTKSKTLDRQNKNNVVGKTI